MFPDEVKEVETDQCVPSSSRKTWVDPGCFPVEHILVSGMNEDSNAVILVDVGGGMGRDVKLFHQRFPHVPGRIVLQDAPIVIAEAQAELPTKIEAMVHDFFTPQPVKSKLLLGNNSIYLLG